MKQNHLDQYLCQIAPNGKTIVFSEKRTTVLSRKGSGDCTKRSATEMRQKTETLPNATRP